jgi:hypothetical protein
MKIFAFFAVFIALLGLVLAGPINSNGKLPFSLEYDPNEQALPTSHILLLFGFKSIYKTICDYGENTFKPQNNGVMNVSYNFTNRNLMFKVVSVLKSICVGNDCVVA